MADIYNINNVAYCASASTVNNVTQSHTANVDDVIKNCVTEDLVLVRMDSFLLKKH